MSQGPQTSRRSLLEGASALGVVAAVESIPLSSTSAQAAPASPEAAPQSAPPLTRDFLVLSSLLTGISLDNSYIQLAGEFWEALTGTPEDTRALHSLIETARKAGPNWQAAIKKAGLMPVAQKVALLWYTGAVNFTQQTGGDSVITYDNALAWRACTFTKPPANCGGPFGYWYDPA